MAGLTFIVPVRHHESVENWPDVQRRMQQTARSIRAQDCADWRCAFVCSRDTPMPDLGPKIEIVRIDRGPMPLPAEDDDPEARFEAIRADKGRRVLAGLMALKPSGYTMVVDYDDLVSRRLAGFVAGQKRVPGWYLRSGQVFDESPVLYRMPHGFDERCGTSLIIHSNFLHVPDDEREVEETYLRQWFGSHKFAKRKLARAGTPLRPLPFDGAMYRIGYAGATSRSASVLRTFFSRGALRNGPIRFLTSIGNIRTLSRSMRREFSLAIL